MGVKNASLGRLLSNSDKFSDEQVEQTVSLLVENAIKQGASDVHIEPHERFLRVRYRIDAMLRGMYKLPLAALPAMTEQIKTLARMDPEDTRLPQEGQYSTLAGADQFEIRVFTMPVLSGEKVVLSISKRLNKPPGLSELGFWGQGLQAIQIALSRTHGLIIVAAPRRNGRASTMHSLLQLLNTPSMSIATIEESIEYRLADASQTLVRPHHGITYHNGLEAALKQDPNVLMVSSLADKKITALAIQAAVSGHLMVAGLHSGSAAAALAHLRTASDEPFLFAHAIRLIICQRLIRRLCVYCRESYTPTREEISEIEKMFSLSSTVARRTLHQLEQQAMHEGMGGHAKLHTAVTGIIGLWRASEDGCERCSYSGYRGSITIFEVLQTDSGALQSALLKHNSPAELRKLALKDGFVPMELDGLVKVLRGQTALPELLRVLGA